ncbi:MAG: hypothetical protein ABI725_00525 [Chloroflexota bacterium]
MHPFPRSISHGAPLDEVAQAIAATNGLIRFIYVERLGADLYRWSPAHRGGPYPLMRETARYLGVNHHGLVLPFRSLADTGLTVIPADASEPARPPEEWTVLEFESAVPVETVRRLILKNQGPDSDDRPLTPDEIQALYDEMGSVLLDDDAAEILPVPRAPRSS